MLNFLRTPHSIFPWIYFCYSLTLTPFIVQFSYKYSSFSGWLYQLICSVRDVKRKLNARPLGWGAPWISKQNGCFLFCSVCLQRVRKYWLKDPHIPKIVVCRFIRGVFVYPAFTLINGHILVFIFLMMVITMMVMTMMVMMSQLVRCSPRATCYLMSSSQYTFEVDILNAF